jgi:LAO/AO transport system kinase
MTQVTTLVERILGGDPRAVARAISMIENNAPDATELLKAVFPNTGRALIVGVTGAPGAGKSSLVDKLALHYRNIGQSVGIVAVDPSSPFSGGALLGDRIRMQTLTKDPKVFIRSMATRGKLGGLAGATIDAVAVLDAAGYDRVLIETVGVGQDEIDVVKAADVSAVVLVPGMGDDIQAIKAGIMEIGDVFVINKADRDGVDRTERELIALLEMSARSDGWHPPIVRTVATQGRGISEFAAAIEGFADHRRAHPALPLERSAVARDRIVELLRDRLLSQAIERTLAPGELDSLAASVAARTRDPYTIVDEVIERLLTSDQPSRAKQARASQGEFPQKTMIVEHLGVAVESIDKALAFWRDGLGLKVEEFETVEDQGVHVAMIPVGESRIELLEPTSDASPVGRFLSKRGPGIHHICLETPNLAESLEGLKARGVRLIDEQPRRGAGGSLIAFIHPSSTGGVLVELVEKQDQKKEKDYGDM